MTAEHAGFELDASAESLRRASLWLEAWCESHQLPHDARFRLDMCLNEALANVIEHGGKHACRGVELKLSKLQDRSHGMAVLDISDAGPPFDPLVATQRDRPGSLDEATPGGLGLTLLRQFSNGLAYRRVDDRNQLSIKIAWTSDAAAA